MDEGHKRVFIRTLEVVLQHQTGEHDQQRVTIRAAPLQQDECQMQLTTSNAFAAFATPHPQILQTLCSIPHLCLSQVDLAG